VTSASSGHPGTLQITTYNSAADFLSRARSVLEAHEAENNLMLGMALRLCSSTDWLTAPPYFATVQSADGIQVSAMRTPPHNLILQGEPSHEALALIARDLGERDEAVPGVLGPVLLSEQFSGVWQERNSVSAELTMRTRVYELKQIDYTPSAAGRLREGTEDDLSTVAEWTEQFQHEALTGGDREQILKATRSRLKARQLVLWEDDRPVSMAAATRKTTTGVSLNLVYTPPRLRNRGYGTACVAALSRRLLKSGHAFVALFADRENATANSLYVRIGYSPVCDFHEYRFGPAK
jgi:uncharacterized protein